MEQAQDTTAAATHAILSGVVDILDGMTRDWDTGFAGRIGPDTSLMRDLTFESIDIVMLIVAIEERFQRKGLPFEELLMENGRYVEDLKVNDIAVFLETRLGSGANA